MCGLWANELRRAAWRLRCGERVWLLLGDTVRVL